METFDLVVIGIGPAGMASAVMGSEMGLKVCAIEKSKIGGECMNVGCIPSKALLRSAKLRHQVNKFSDAGLKSMPMPDVLDPFAGIHQNIDYIREKKSMGMFAKAELLIGKGAAEFTGRDTVRVGEREIRGRRIFICAGTRPMIPPIPGIDTVDFLTNENMFALSEIPKSMTVVGGGAIGCEMAQAFSRLGCKVSLVQMDEHLLPYGDSDRVLEEVFEKESIDVYNSRNILKVEKSDTGVRLETDKGETLDSEKLLLAAGRVFDGAPLQLEKAGVKYDHRGIKVDKYLRTSNKKIFAPGDVNGEVQLSHSAMHQGMIAIMNSMMPGFFKRNFRKYVVPWTVFTDPQVSVAGLNEKQLQERGIAYEAIKMKYEDYGAAIAENIPEGYVKALVSKTGKIYGARIVGEGSGEMINEWALAIQNNLRMHNLMFLQHSFPTMGFLTKRSSEQWMMNRIAPQGIKNLIAKFFRLMNP